MENGFAKVVSPIDDTPASKAGMQPEDFIIAIDGASVLGKNLSEAVDVLRGPIGSEVTITVQKARLSLFLTIIRDEIKSYPFVMV